MIETGHDLFETRHRHKNGQLIDIEVSVSYAEIDGGIFYVFSRDISERKQAELALQESETRFRDLFENSPDPCWMINENNLFMLCNNSAAKILGYDTVEELKATHPSKLSPEIQPDGENSFEKANTMMAIAHDKGIHRFEWQHRRRNGECFPVEVTLAQLEISGTKKYGFPGEHFIGKTPGFLSAPGRNDLDKLAEMIGLTLNGEPQNFEFWAVRSNGEQFLKEVHLYPGEYFGRKDGSFYPAHMVVAPIFNSANEITHFIGTQQDMTEHEALEEKFRQAQKMEAIGTLVGGIAHDFNNMLAGMTGNLYLAKKRATKLPDVVNKLTTIETLSFRASEMIQQLLTFARKGIIEMQPFGLTSFMREVSKLNEASIPENISLNSYFCNEELVINGDATQLQQALMNLLNNARSAVAQVENPSIQFRLEQFIANSREISLVISDIIMPKLGGIKAVQWMRAIRPDLKVIFATGYDKDEILKDKMPDMLEITLSKPYSITKLSQMIREQLDH